MRNIFFVTALLCFWGCKDDSIDDPASRVEGAYKVTFYIVNGDTLISPQKGNMSAYPFFEMKVTRQEADIVQVMYLTDANGGGAGASGIKLEDDHDNKRFRLIMPSNTIDTYFGYADGNIFYTDGAGWDVERDKNIRTQVVGVKIK